VPLLIGKEPNIMSETANLLPPALPHGWDHGFTVKSISGCRLVFGSVPLSDLGMITHGFGKKALMDVDLADLIGATYVIGMSADLEKLRRLDLPVSAKRHRDYLAAEGRGLNAVATWLRTGERGKSSNAMCQRIFELPLEADSSHPHDPADLRRCLQMLDATNAHDRVPMVADLSPEWGRLVGAWDRLVAVFSEERHASTSAPLTYQMMQELLRSTV
jgi:hypothetical protein